ncbi:hypothetical protein DICVIV_05113 [Dictyocaulus viviparus]|uniref:Uncharacterized protein n=1 Tax=Dictyocaulus viviparus TaxID=29172 RepID=A0A0D8XVY9_DICVI|nr:hypothetical protein DICVIV_05113 [Dictyocaulus viviparus]
MLILPSQTGSKHLKNLPPVLIKTLARLFTSQLPECKVPSRWKTSMIVLLHRKEKMHNKKPITAKILLFVDISYGNQKLELRIHVFRNQSIFDFVPTDRTHTTYGRSADGSFQRDYSEIEHLDR